MFSTNYNYGESLGSNSSSSNSLLAAANTVILGTSSSPFQNSPIKMNKFSNTLLLAQQNENDLDFDLHYVNSESKRKKSDNSYGVLFRDDNDLFNDSQDMGGDEDEELELEQNVEHRQIAQIPKSILHNRISMNMPIETNNFINKAEAPSLSSSHCTSITPTSNIFTDSTPQNSVQNRHNRTLMKQQLMKQQIEEMDRKSGNLSSTLLSNNDSLNMILGNNLSLKNETNIPSSLTTLETVPRNLVSDVYKTQLEYPTIYHVQQMTKIQQNQNNPNESKKRLVSNKPRSRINSGKPNSSKPHQYQQQVMSSSDLQKHIDHSNNIEITRNTPSLQSDYLLPSTVSSQYSYDSQSSNLDSIRLTSPSNSSFSQNDYIDEYDDFVADNLFIGRKSLSTHLTNSQLQDEINEIEEVLNLPKTAPNEGYLKTMTPPLAPSIIRPSSSCPTNIARLKNIHGLTDDEIKMLIKERQKKDNHNMIERRRRFNINDRIKELGTILPKSCLNEKQNKGSILKASVDYIRILQRDAIRVKEMEQKLGEMTLKNRQLMEKIKSMENLKSDSSRADSGPQSLINLLKSPSLINQQRLETLIKSDNTVVNFETDQKQINQFEQFINEQENFKNFDPKTMDEILQLEITDDPLMSHQSLMEDNFMDAF